MKIHIEHNEINLVFEVPQLIPKEDTEKIVSIFYDTLEKIVATPPPMSSKIIKAEEENNRTPAKAPVYEERPPFRDRLPNNVVDVEKLDIKKAVTENALVRCPKCGQSHVLVVDTGNAAYMMRKFYSATGNNDEFRIVAEFDSVESSELNKMSCMPETDRKLYFEDIQTLPMIDDKDFVVDNKTQIYCPVCGWEYDFFDWKNAYENPLSYFEHDKICDACGGEKLEKLTQADSDGATHKTVYQCDSCGLQTEYEV